MIKILRQLFCKHDFKYIDVVFGFDGDIPRNQYKCTKCGRYDYLVPEEDPDHDWKHGKGDEKLCSLFTQLPDNIL